MFGLGFGEMLLIGGVVLLVFGSKKLPELGSGLAKGIKNFKSGLNDEDATGTIAKPQEKIPHDSKDGNKPS